MKGLLVVFPKVVEVWEWIPETETLYFCSIGRFVSSADWWTLGMSIPSLRSHHSLAQLFFSLLAFHADDSIFFSWCPDKCSSWPNLSTPKRSEWGIFHQGSVYYSNKKLIKQRSFPDKASWRNPKTFSFASLPLISRLGTGTHLALDPQKVLKIALFSCWASKFKIVILKIPISPVRYWSSLDALGPRYLLPSGLLLACLIRLRR